MDKRHAYNASDDAAAVPLQVWPTAPPPVSDEALQKLSSGYAVPGSVREGTSVRIDATLFTSCRAHLTELCTTMNAASMSRGLSQDV